MVHHALPSKGLTPLPVHTWVQVLRISVLSTQCSEYQYSKNCRLEPRTVLLKDRGRSKEGKRKWGKESKRVGVGDACIVGGHANPKKLKELKL